MNTPSSVQTTGGFDHKRPRSDDSANESNKKRQNETLDDRLLEFGKHKGRTYFAVYSSEPGYCQWAVKQDNPTGALLAFQDYLKAKGPQKSAQQQAHHSANGQGVYNPPSGLGFEAWKDDYIDGNLRRGLAGYCWDWLEYGECMGCRYKHEYPRAWSQEQRNSHQQRLLLQQMFVYSDFCHDVSDGDDDDLEHVEEEEEEDDQEQLETAHEDEDVDDVDEDEDAYEEEGDEDEEGSEDGEQQERKRTDKEQQA